MEILDVTLLIMAYTSLVITLFLQMVCYHRNMEPVETIWFSSSLLLLIVSLTIQYFYSSSVNTNHTPALTQIAMLLVGLTTWLNVLEERKHSLHRNVKGALMITSAFLIVLVSGANFTGMLELTQYVIVVFLGLSVLSAMILIRKTKPKVTLAHREKVERIMALCFLIFVPISLVANYVAELEGVSSKLGFTLPLVFIILSGTKIWDDIQRLSLLRLEVTPGDQSFQNYSLTIREQEVARLLIQGRTYVQISDELFVSVPTVKTHVSNIYKKCKTNNRIEFISLITR